MNVSRGSLAIERAVRVTVTGVEATWVMPRLPRARSRMAPRKSSPMASIRSGT